MNFTTAGAPVVIALYRLMYPVHTLSIYRATDIYAFYVTVLLPTRMVLLG